MTAFKYWALPLSPSPAEVSTLWTTQTEHPDHWLELCRYTPLRRIKHGIRKGQWELDLVSSDYSWVSSVSFPRRTVILD